jgi:SSS family solute:Na+ symporter
LAQDGRGEQVPELIPLLNSDRVEVRSAAAYAILRIGRRVPYRLSWLDWVVIAGYFVSMLAIGWYYSRRNPTTDDYLLAGRTVRSLSAGLSLFASLFSTLSYLALPGEMIKHGPIYAAGTIAALPLIGLIVGWFLIPFIMKLKVTTAYELLEGQLGLGVRMLASFLFLLLRVLWMAALTYATVAVVLVPLLNLDPSYVPFLCIFLGLITVIYTAMGGLRAVMLTNVIKAAILFGLAVLALVVISARLGGFSAWLPTRWPSYWPEPVWGYDPTIRVSFLGVFVATLVWFVCTSGSDQMAIQRYLSTKDIRAARRALVSLLVADGLVALFLSGVGLAVSAYFWANPHLVPDGLTILGDSDKLFGRFMAVGFPSGLCGLAITGLLIAAMSSLSSGINSACSVVTVDFIGRFRKDKQPEQAQVRLAKYVSVGIGVVVVTLACFVGLVQGNLVELCYKVVNLLVAPLFGLFFMAMFVRRATGIGTLVGAAAGLAVVIVISFWQELTGTPPPISLFVAMPASLVVQVAVGLVASWVTLAPK